MQDPEEIEQEVIDAVGLQEIRENGKVNFGHTLDSMISTLNEIKKYNEQGEFKKMGGMYFAFYKMECIYNLFMDEYVFRKICEQQGKPYPASRSRD